MPFGPSSYNRLFLRAYLSLLPSFSPLSRPFLGSFFRTCRSWRTSALLRSPQPQVSHPDQVVRRRHQRELPAHLPLSDVSRLAPPARGLHPAEDFLDPFAQTQADLITGMARRASVNGGFPVAGVLGHVRNHLHLAGRPDEGVVVVSLVAPDRDRACLFFPP